MGKFCSRCGSLNDESTGLCPVCDREKLEAMKAPQRKINFCTICGTPIDQMTGTCPNCTKPVEAAPVVEAAPIVEETPVAVEPVVADTSAEVTEVVEEAVTEEPVAVAVSEVPAFDPASVQAPIADAPAVAVEYKKKRSGVGKVILTIFLSFLLFITSLLSVVVICVRYTTSESAVLSVLEDVDYAEMLNSIYTESYGGDSQTFTEDLSEYFEENFEVSVSEKQIEAFIEDSTVLDFLSEKISDYVSDLYNGTDEFEITKKEVHTLLRENADVIEEHFDVEISDESVDELADWLVDDELLEEISTSAIKDESSAVYYTLNVGFSYFTLAILLALVVLCLLGMGLNDLSKGVLGAGIVFIIIGGIFTALTLILAGLPALLNAVIGENLISTLALKLLFANLGIFAAVLLLGVLILVARYLVRRFVVKPRQRKAA